MKLYFVCLFKKIFFPTYTVYSILCSDIFHNFSKSFKHSVIMLYMQSRIIKHHDYKRSVYYERTSTFFLNTQFIKQNYNGLVRCMLSQDPLQISHEFPLCVEGNSRHKDPSEWRVSPATSRCWGALTFVLTKCFLSTLGGATCASISNTPGTCMGRLSTNTPCFMKIPKLPPAQVFLCYENCFYDE